MYDFLKQLCEIAAPGGYERRVQTVLQSRWQHHAKQITITPVGNFIAHIGGSGPHLMLVGHSDEIAFTVKHISDDGFIFFTSGQRSSGSPDLRGPYFTPMGQPAFVISRNSSLKGQFATLTGHILTPQQRQKTTLDWNDYFVDVFMKSRKQVEAAGIHVGSRIVWNPATRRQNNFYIGKAMDNRVSLAVMDAVLERLEHDRLQYDLYLGSTIQEESGLYGARSINREVQATYAIAIDTGLCGDVPGVDERNVSTRLGDGPIVLHKDLYSYDLRLTGHIEDVAETNNLPFQRAAYDIYGTDAGALLQEGTAAAAIGVPTRYTHSPFETVHADDLEATVDLLLHTLYTPLKDD